MVDLWPKGCRFDLKQYFSGFREKPKEGYCYVLAALRRIPSIAGYIHTSPARHAANRMGNPHLLPGEGGEGVWVVYPSPIERQ